MEHSDQRWTSREVARLLTLVEAERRYYQEILELVPVPIAILSETLEIKGANRSFRNRFNIRTDQMTGLAIHTVLPDNTRYTLQPVRDWDSQAAPLNILVVEDLPTVSLQTAGLDAVSRTAARVVHDANNLAMIMAGYGEDLLHGLPAGSPLKDNVNEILAATERLSSLAAKLAPYTPQPPQQMDQVVFDKVLVSAPRKLFNEAIRTLSLRGKVSASLQAPKLVRIVCRNRKEVLNPDQVARYFEPDLSPQPAAPSMAAVYQLVNQCGGTLSCESSATEGTTVTLILPAAEPIQEKLTVLAVDDEAGIRGLIAKALPPERYMVLGAADADEALHKARTSDRPIDILITDVMMPGSNGKDLANEFQLVCPGAKILFISGYTGENGPDISKLSAGTGFLAKPFTLTALEAKVKEMLAGQSTAASA